MNARKPASGFRATAAPPPFRDKPKVPPGAVGPGRAGTICGVCKVWAFGRHRGTMPASLVQEQQATCRLPRGARGTPRRPTRPLRSRRLRTDHRSSGAAVRWGCSASTSECPDQPLPPPDGAVPHGPHGSRPPSGSPAVPLRRPGEPVTGLGRSISSRAAHRGLPPAWRSVLLVTGGVQERASLRHPRVLTSARRGRVCKHRVTAFVSPAIGGGGGGPRARPADRLAQPASAWPRAAASRAPFGFRGLWPWSRPAGPVPRARAPGLSLRRRWTPGKFPSSVGQERQGARPSWVARSAPYGARRHPDRQPTPRPGKPGRQPPFRRQGLRRQRRDWIE